MSEFIKLHSTEVVSYCFDSPLAVFETVESDSELSQMITEYGSTLRQQIYQLLITHASKAYSSVFKKVRKNVMFNDHEMQPNYSEPSHLYSAPVNSYGGPGRLSSVPYNGHEFGDPVSCASAAFSNDNE
jgi:hypothetical protein